MGDEIISEDVDGVSAGALGSKASPNVAENDGSNSAGIFIHSDKATAKQVLGNVLWAPATEEDIHERCEGTEKARTSFCECVSSTRC